MSAEGHALGVDGGNDGHPIPRGNMVNKNCCHVWLVE